MTSRAKRLAASASALALAALCALPVLQAPDDPDWLRRPLHDDAYYFLVVARNVAQGRGATVEQRPVNGFQPLHLLVTTSVGAATGWHETRTPAALALTGWLLYNVVGLWCIVRLLRAMAPTRPAAAWFGGAIWVLHSYGQRAALNGMETALALCAWLLATHALLTWERERSLRAAALVGGALGLAFLARNDAVVLCPAFALVALRERARWRAHLPQLALAALVTLGVALPWLVFNLWTSGSVVPQSGAAEAAGGLYDFGRHHQGAEVLASIVRNGSPLPFPLSRVALGWRAVMALPVAVALVALWVWVWRRNAGASGPLLFLGVAFLSLCMVYAIVFGAPHMATRWLAPGVVLSALVCGLAVADLHARRTPASQLAVVGGLLLLLAARAFTSLGDGRLLQPTNTWQLLRFVRANRPPGPIGSFQSGLLAWAEPEVVNLDGKVNPAVLRALQSGHFAEWLVGSDVRTVVDQDLFGYEHAPRLQAHFDVAYPEPGLVVLRRRSAEQPRARGRPRE